MKINRPMAARLAIATVGGVLLVGVAGVAFADSNQGSDDVDVNVNIEALTGPGALTMTVAANATTLTEGTSDDAAQRQFFG
ncbi:hypothetical protein, partial [Mycobacterium avium]|uniref:hypothetical protein n=1 Tax=Mycobacterium avium TaxID=1764 RepID=UPI0018C86694